MDQSGFLKDAGQVYTAKQHASRKYYLKNKARIDARNAAYYDARRVDINAQRRTNNKNTPERAAQKKAYAIKNKHRLNKYWGDYKKKHPWAGLLGAARRRATAAGIEFSLSFAWAKSIWTGRCAMTGIEFIPGRRASGCYSPSIDRRDPGMGYTQANCRFILFSINAMKGSGADEDVAKIANAIASAMNGKITPPHQEESPGSA